MPLPNPVIPSLYRRSAPIPSFRLAPESIAPRKSKIPNIPFIHAIIPRFPGALPQASGLRQVVTPGGFAGYNPCNPADAAARCANRNWQPAAGALTLFACPRQ